ncbi:hypothetical protein ACIA5C_32280 [Actinoplanes sp. NPDC051343]|uniref:hypothetical protein n=1 Tax=Actinoplanes sp. NPDC051343 TaxID=3363906 RepID=UPI00378C8754
MQVLSSFSVMIKLVLVCVVIGFVLGIVTAVAVLPDAAGARPAPLPASSSSPAPKP